jgi:hypothetical protein
MTAERPHDPSDEELADLARLVDGTLPEERRVELEARVAESPELTAIVQRQALALDALRRTAAETGAPARLRADVERLRDAPRTNRSVRRLAAARLALAAAAAAVAAALALPGILSSGLSVAEAASLARKPPTQGAPAGVRGTPQLLAVSVDGVPFPNYAGKFGWKATGARTDHRDGHDVTTVYYAKRGRKLTYSIVAGSALGKPSAPVVRRHSEDYRTLRAQGRIVVTWERDGHTCVITAAGLRAAELIALADWRGKGAIPF